MKAEIVVGLGFGDEGKGAVTAWRCRQAERPIVVRYNGGHQAGHTVVKNGYRHVFSSFGSGTLEGAPTYWSKYCTVYPTAFMNEWRALKAAGYTPTIHIDPLCPITTPSDVFQNQIRSSNLHGTVGVGFGETIERHEKHYCLYAKDLLSPYVLRQKLKLIREQYYRFGRYEQDSFIQDCKDMLDVCIIEKPPFSLCDRIIFEGAQGILLDQRFGFFPHVTRSNTTSQNALAVWKDILNEYQRLYKNPENFLVTRSYLTRHGNGPMGPTIPVILKNNEHETNVKHQYQGNFRASEFNNELFNYALRCEEEISGNKNTIVMTCCDQVEKVPKIEFDQIIYDIIKRYSETE